jgi:phasin
MTANPQFQAPNPADVRPFFGDVAEKTAAQTKDNLGRMGAAAGEATNQMKDVYSTTFKGVQEYSAKVLEFTNLNLNAAAEHVKKLAGVKSPAEFWALTTEHLRQQFEALSRQAQELAAIAQKTTFATTESVKTGIQRKS